MTTPTQPDLKALRRAKNIARLFIICLIAGCLYLCSLPVQVEALTATSLPAVELKFVQFQEPEPPAPEPVPEQVKHLLAESSDIKVALPPVIEESVSEPPPAPPVIETPKPEKKVEKKIRREVIQKKSEKRTTPKKVEQTLTVKADPSSAVDNVSKVSEKSVSLAGSSSELQAKNKLASLLVALIEKKKKYPKAAIRSGTEGVCHAGFKFDKEGRIIAGTLTAPSGKAVLDRASASLARELVGTNFNTPNSGIEIQVPIRYELTNI